MGSLRSVSVPRCRLYLPVFEDRSSALYRHAEFNTNGIHPKQNFKISCDHSVTRDLKNIISPQRTPGAQRRVQLHPLAKFLSFSIRILLDGNHWLGATAGSSSSGARFIKTDARQSTAVRNAPRTANCRHQRGGQAREAKKRPAYGDLSRAAVGRPAIQAMVTRAAAHHDRSAIVARGRVRLRVEQVTPRPRCRLRNRSLRAKRR
jgi:hypothetical protein